MVKASKTCWTADANYGLTRLFYAQTNTIYRFYGYDLVIDDALAIVYAIIGHCKIWPHQICRLHCRVKRIRYPIFCVWIGVKLVCPPLRIRSPPSVWTDSPPCGLPSSRVDGQSINIGNICRSMSDRVSTYQYGDTTFVIVSTVLRMFCLDLTQYPLHTIFLELPRSTV